MNYDEKRPPQFPQGGRQHNLSGKNHIEAVRRSQGGLSAGRSRDFLTPYWEHLMKKDEAALARRCFCCGGAGRHG